LIAAEHGPPIQEIIMDDPTAMKKRAFDETEATDQDIAFVGDVVPTSDDEMSFRTENMYDNVGVVPQQGY
jgi:hypothetical protein